ncbi:MAG: type 1 glutamine amidotransferase domain-containing protein [Pseudomonadota bacterium]
MVNPKIFMIATSSSMMNNGEPTGLWLGDLTTPYYTFADAGCEVTLTSMSGGPIPVEPRSLLPRGTNERSIERYLGDPSLQEKCETTLRFDAVSLAGFDALFLSGGHGAMFDFPGNEALTGVIEAFDRATKVIAAVSHGPAGLIDARSETGAPFVRGRHVAAFTETEERAAGLQDAMPFGLESRLRALGALYQAGPDSGPFAVRDGRLITGQNPASAARVADLALDAIGQTKEAA